MVLQDLIPFAKACQIIPGRPSLKTLHRWRLHGVRGGIRLHTQLVGGRRFTTKNAIEEFISATTAASAGNDLSQVVSTRQVQDRIDQAEAELARDGF